MGKKNKRKTKTKAKASESSSSSPSSSPVAARRPISRRKMLGLLLGVPLVGVAGVGVHRHDVKKRALHDLSALGNGSPAIVQIHDPSCRLCRRLMANTKKALGERDDITYRIADITKTSHYRVRLDWYLRLSFLGLRCEEWPSIPPTTSNQLSYLQSRLTYS